MSLKFAIESRNLTTIKTDLLVVNMHDGKVDAHSFANQIDKKLSGELKKLLKREKFDGKAGQIKLINTHGKLSAENVAVLGLGDRKKFDLEVVRKGAAKVFQLAKEIHAQNIVTAVHGGHLNVVNKGDCAQAVVEGIKLAAYEFTLYKKPKNKSALRLVSLLCPDKNKVKEVQAGMKRGEALAEGTSLARDLVNTPACDMQAENLAAVAKKNKGIKTRIYSKAEIKKMKMGSYLSVNQGSDAPPAFIEMHYKPKTKPKKTVAIIGKGVMFDSGGLSLKPPKFMETMKDDMAGGAATVALMSIIAKLAPKHEVWGLVAATDNMPDAKATKPGDVVTAMNGKTIEILNTDAEGRLTMADALHYACTRKKPDYVIDMATLTGACLVALGQRIAAIMGNDDDLIQSLIAAAKKTHEPLWQLPLHEEYKKDLQSTVADIKNIGGPYGGTITAGLFLQEFVSNTKWAHIDIAGPSWTEAPYPYEKKGGTGVMVRTLAEFLKELS